MTIATLDGENPDANPGGAVAAVAPGPASAETTEAPRSATDPGDAVRAAAAAGRAVLDVVIPVYNEEKDIEGSVRRLHAHLTATFPYPFRITIADNASTDGTYAIARRLTGQLPGVAVAHLPQKGRGRALKAVWSGSDAPILAYMDVDLSTDLAALLPLVAPLISGHSDLAIGTRLSRASRVVRGAKREVISRCYNLILRGTLQAGFSDAQCGFKAIRRDVAERLLPLVEDTGWFFDTEMLVLAERAGLRIHEVPVDWVDDPDSRVDIVATAVADLRGVARLARGLATGSLPLATLRSELGRNAPEVAPGVESGLVRQLIRFGGVGVASTLAYLVLYVLLRGVLGAFAANLLALLATAIANTAANRRLTFGVRGAGRRGRQHFEGLLVFGLGLVLTTGALSLLHALVSSPGKGVELAVLICANLAATVLRFLLFRAWVFHPRRTSPKQEQR
ncbi:dolichyl-phosphate beta-glucosyltransferase [Cryptosporangium aurantiacum]|uniref:dolichyl-phosphate beta-glucosyltransferase n=1 Tax=Cryptosporangium aurantiacum TaxID=134849 RepID=A0A1M7RMH0_9ACTN|nr:dolichyl-phosphate beta-glucosyltransferase [Cryptosporangium aurantiacum]SHN47503.1 GtrA-like protein [Cryptosporangium aurantiacum]